jgi:hypothetical protein
LSFGVWGVGAQAIGRAGREAGHVHRAKRRGRPEFGLWIMVNTLRPFVNFAKKLA